MRTRRFFRRVWCAFAFSACALAQQYTVTTIAGYAAASGFTDGAASTAQFSSPGAVAWAANGNLYISDGSNQRIRLLANGNVSTIAGNGSAGYSGDKGSGSSASLYSPSGIAVDASNNVYIADSFNNVIRKVDTSGNITTFAGNNADGPGLWNGDGTLAVGADLNGPLGVAVDPAGNVYIADTVNNAIRKVTAGTGIISAIVGSGNTSGRLNHPWGLAYDASSGALYIVDNGNQRIAKFVAGSANPLTNFAGGGTLGDGGLATLAKLSNPIGVAVDSAGNVYIAEGTVNGRIRKVAVSGPNAGVMTTIAGNGAACTYTGDGGPALSAGFCSPRGVAIDKSGNIYVADSGNNVIRRLQVSVPTIASGPGAVTNAAGYQAQISPGALATVFGGTLLPAPVQASIPYPTTLGGASVSVNGKAAPVFYADSGQINFQVPWSTATGTATIAMTVNGVGSNTVTVPVVSAGPGIFTYGSNNAIVQNSDASASLNGPPGIGTPAVEGTTVTAYLTGSGPVDTPQTDGQAASSTALVWANPRTNCTATIGGIAATVTFCGLAPTWVGLVQVNLTTPTGMTPGSYPLIVTIAGQASNSANISVK